MKYLFYWGAALLVTAGAALFPAASARAQSDDAADVARLKALNAAFIASYPTKDSATLKTIFADDFVLINPSGKRFTKADVLKLPANILSTHVDTVEVHLLGNNVGLVHARAAFVSEDGGKQTKGMTDYLDVYEKRKGKWVAVAAHVTYLGDQ